MSMRILSSFHHPNKGETRALSGMSVRARDKSNGHSLKRNRMRARIACVAHISSKAGVQFLPLAESRKSGCDNLFVGKNDEQTLPEVRCRLDQGRGFNRCRFLRGNFFRPLWPSELANIFDF